MSGTAKPQSSSDNFWKDSSSQISLGFKQKENFGDFFSSVDETPDFHDPYSELSLFLSQQIKQQMGTLTNFKKWSVKLQEELIEKITPAFQKKFPHYRLGVAALKKTWEKISYYSHQIQSQKEAITQDGKLNIHFFIRENLKGYHQHKSTYDLQPFHYAHKLAVKLSECIAAIDGTRPKIEDLAKLIWSMQRHLLHYSSELVKSPYDEYDKIDKLIVKTVLELNSKDPLISQKELEHGVKESLQSLHDLPSFASLDKMTCNVSALLAEKLYPSSSFHTLFFGEQKNAISNFIRRHAGLCKSSQFFPQLSELVRRILALYSLASGLPKNLTRDEIKEAVLASYPSPKEDKPDLPQSVYAFIAAESVLMKNEEFCHSIEYVIDAICSAYEEVKYLPYLEGKEAHILEAVVWKIISETESLLEKLPYRIGQRIEEEIANILIDNPSQSFASVVQETVKFFKRIKELALSKNASELDRKIRTWTLQGDMLCRFIRLDTESSLFKMIKDKANEYSQRHESFTHTQFVSEVSQMYLKAFPELSVYAPQVHLRVWILYKYTWYTLFSKSEESSFDRFVKWHSSSLLSQSHLREKDSLVKQLEELCKKVLPIIPFNASQYPDLFNSPK